MRLLTRSGFVRWQTSIFGKALCQSITHRREMHKGLRSFPAWFVRGGTSNGLVIRRDTLPREQEQWQSIFPAAMGSGDAYGRQLDGIGSGVSSTSKIVILDAASSPDEHDVDYTIIQAGVKDTVLDMAGNCGNMSSIVGPSAWDMGYISEDVKMTRIESDAEGQQWATVRALNTNTSKTLSLRFRVSGAPPAYCPEGEYVMDGVTGSNSCITMSFLDPAGAKTGSALPTGNVVDILQLNDGSEIEASLVDVGNPGVFVAARDLGYEKSRIRNELTPQGVEADATLKARLEMIRRAGASAMGLDPNTDSVPKIVLLFPADASADFDIGCLAMSMGQAHRAVPLTLALCLGAATRLPGTTANRIFMSSGRELAEDTVTVGHPSGKVDVGTVIEGGKIITAKLLRTGRVLMRGEVFY